MILVLGTNDFQTPHPYNDAWAAAQGIAALVREIRGAPIEPGMPVPEILIVCPPPIGVPRGAIAPKFQRSRERSAGLADAYLELSVTLGCHFFDAGSVTPSSRVDGVHLDGDQHRALGLALADPVARALSS